MIVPALLLYLFSVYAGNGDKVQGVTEETTLETTLEIIPEVEIGVRMLETTIPAIDNLDDYDEFEISVDEKPKTNSYHCAVKNPSTNNAENFVPNRDRLQLLEKSDMLAIEPSHFDYKHTKQVRQQMCQSGFDPFNVELAVGSWNRRFRNTLRLMVYNTPSLLPNLRVVRSDLDRGRKREPQLFWRFEHAARQPLEAEFDYDNYFFKLRADFADVIQFSKILVAFKLHKRSNDFNETVSRKVNLDLGIAEVILSSFGIWVMREKSVAELMVKALNGIRTEATASKNVQLGFDVSLKEATDQVDPLLYSYVWLLAMAEKHEVVRIKDGRRTVYQSEAATAEALQLTLP